MEPPVKALCVAPFGMEEGTQADVPPQELVWSSANPPVSVSSPVPFAATTASA